MLSKHYNWTFNLSIAAMVALVVCADQLPQWKSYLLAGACLATVPALVVYFKRQWAMSEKSE